MAVRLGLDASLRVPTCAVSVGDEITVATGAGRPVEDFAEVIRQALRQTGLGLGDVDEIVAGVGPGSYMGVRSAVATANALALALERPVTGVLSVDALAAMVPPRPNFVVAIPAGRGRWFVATYRSAGPGLERGGGPGLERGGGPRLERGGGPRLERGGLPELVENAGPDAWRATAPGTDGGGGMGLAADGVLAVAERHRHLAIETCRPEVSPRLPPASIGSRR